MGNGTALYAVSFRVTHKECPQTVHKANSDHPIVSTDEAVTLVGGGHLDRNVLNISTRHAPRVVAADSGADRALQFGETPEAVIGDLDSVSDAARSLLKGRLHEMSDQDKTDFDKALSAISAPLVLAVGFTGGRLDHTMAALNVLARNPKRAVILLTREDATFLAPTRIALDLPKGCRFALLPMESCQVSTQGLRWNLDRQVLAPAGLVSSSNFAEGPVTVVSRGRLLISLEAGQLPVAIAAVLGR
jgi:thiamine pyrophosphokinase